MSKRGKEENKTIQWMAVVIVVALCSIIVMPIIMGINLRTVDNMDLEHIKSLVDSGTSFYIDTKNNGVKAAMLGSNVIDDLSINIEGATGSVIVKKDGLIELSVSLNDKCYVKLSGQTKDQIAIVNNNNCNIYKDSILNGADPVIRDGMIPVSIASNGKVTKADITKSWYDYYDNKWANMVLVSENSREIYQHAAANTIINRDDILSYFVWVPRFKYQLFNSNESKTIDVVFESNSSTKSQGTIEGDYLTHPAFTFGDDELNGIWVGKYETTGSLLSPTILPGEKTIIGTNKNDSTNISEKFTSSQLLNNTLIYGINDDAHVLKNSEWGAVAYLTNSIYGRCRNNKCQEVSRNNSMNYITGSSAGNANGISIYEYNTEQGYLASTTGNITGIYDMAGGAWEAVMADFVTSTGVMYSGRSVDLSVTVHGNSGFNGIYANGFGELTNGLEFPESKYFNSYFGADIYSLCGNNSCLGDAMAETMGWNKDYSGKLEPTLTWILRGGSYDSEEKAGLFAYKVDASGAGAFRISLGK